MAGDLPFGSFTMNVVLGLVMIVAGFCYVYAKTAANRRSLPPGPKGWPVLGNIHDLPPPGAREWEFWHEHKDKFGPISSVTVLGNTLVIVNSSELAFELLEKRSAIYSARPRAVFSMEMCGWEHSLSGQTTQLREYRKRMFEVIGTKAKAARFNGLQDREVARFLLRILNDPRHFLEHVRTEVGATILKLTYGYTIDTTKRDPLVDIAERALEQFSLSIVPGAWLVDSLPILRYIPAWMPGAGFKRTAREWKATWMTLAELPIKFARKQFKEKSYSPSYVSELYERVGEKATADEQELIKWTAASMYAAGADTSVGVLAIFFLGMVTHPAVQANAQEEIDRVVGRERLPTYDDRERLPYVEAVFKEAFRWHVLAPSALPHVCTKDDVCEGYLIPKGAIIVPNVWWFAHDPAVYPNPGVFDPTRFLGPNPAPDPLTYAFGFGRRICPGKQFADLSIWLTMVRSLAVFDISKGKDDKGIDIEPDVKFTAGMISHPVPYTATIKPRSPEHERLVRQVQDLHPEEESHAAELDTVSF